MYKLKVVTHREQEINTNKWRKYAIGLPANFFYTHQAQREYAFEIHSANEVWDSVTAEEI